MSTSRVLSACLVAVCCTVTAGPSAMANLITNGDFESVTAGQFDAWSYNGAGAVAAVSTSPSVIDGIYSAELLSGITDGGVLYHKVSNTDHEKSIRLSRRRRE